MTYVQGKDTYQDLWWIICILLTLVFCTMGVEWQIHHPPGWPAFLWAIPPAGYVIRGMVISWQAAKKTDP